MKQLLDLVLAAALALSGCTGAGWLNQAPPNSHETCAASWDWNARFELPCPVRVEIEQFMEKHYGITSDTQNQILGQMIGRTAGTVTIAWYVPQDGFPVRVGVAEHEIIEEDADSITVGRILFLYLRAPTGEELIWERPPEVTA